MSAIYDRLTQWCGLYDDHVAKITRQSKSVRVDLSGYGGQMRVCASGETWDDAVSSALDAWACEENIRGRS